MTDNDDDEKYICHGCIGESYLAQEVKTTGTMELCNYCGATNHSWPISTLADSIDSAFKDHYRRTSDQPDSWQQMLLSDRESDYDWEREGEPVLDAIEDAADIPYEAAQDVLHILNERHNDFDAAAMGEESEFSFDSYYEEKGTSDQTWQDEWYEFEKSLKTEARFFSRTAASHLASVFGGIDKFKTKRGNLLIVEAGPELAIDHLFRARVFQSDNKLEEALCRPDKHLGSPPPTLANAGRMNARGISVFYGATQATVAIAEVRPPVGGSVAVARFAIISNLRLLDLTALDDVQDGGSIFDCSLKARLERVAFLRTLGRRIARPVMPEDEAFDYLATQAIADFLATENDPRFDGIIFRSVQSETGRNVVLFQKAARVEEMEFPEGTEIEARTGRWTDEGWEDDYAVTESVPKPKADVPRSGDDNFASLPIFPGSLPLKGSDYRTPALRVDPHSVVVHSIAWVEYHSQDFAVTRHRFEKRDWKF